MGYLVKDRKPPTPKLKPKDIYDIKISYERLVKKMATKYNVSRATIRGIYLEKTWRQIKLKKV